MVLIVVAGVYLGCCQVLAQNETGTMMQPSREGLDPDDLNVVVIESTGFVPDPITIRAGAAVTWMNNDTVPHTVISTMPGVEGTPAIDSGAIAPGERFTFPFTEPGTYVYSSITTGMTGTIIVGGMGPGQSAGNVTQEKTAAPTPIPGGNETAPSLPSAGPQSLPENATPDVVQKISPDEEPAGVISVNLTANQTPTTPGIETPSRSGIAPPDVAGTSTTAETTAMTQGDRSSTTPNPTPSTMTVTIAALAVLVFWIAIKRRK